MSTPTPSIVATLRPIGRRIDAIRIALRSQPTKKQFAAALGVTQSAYSNWLKGKNGPENSVLVRLREDYGVGTGWPLLGEVEDLPAPLIQRMAQLAKTTARLKRDIPTFEVFREVRSAMEYLSDRDKAVRTLEEPPPAPPWRHIRLKPSSDDVKKRLDELHAA